MKIQLQFAHLRDALRVRYGVGNFRPKRRHLLRAAQIVRILLHSHPVLVADFRVGLDAEQDILQVRVFFQRVMRIVGRDHRDVQFLAQRHQPLVYGRQLRNVPVLHKLKVVSPAENFLVPRRRLARRVHIAPRYRPRHFPAWAARQRYDALAVLRQQLAVYARLVVEAFQVRLGDELDQIVVPPLAVRKQRHVVGRLVVRIALVAAGGRDIGFAADYGLDARFLRDLVKVDRAVHPAVVRDGEAVHPQLHGAVDEILQAAKPVKHAVFGVRVQVREQRRGLRQVRSKFRFSAAARACAKRKRAAARMRS